MTDDARPGGNQEGLDVTLALPLVSSMTWRSAHESEPSPAGADDPREGSWSEYERPDGPGAIRTPRRTREVLELDSDDEEGSLLSRSVANGQTARARRRRRLASFHEEVELAYWQRQAERDQRASQPESSWIPTSRARTGWSDAPTRASDVSTLLDAASRSAYQSPDEVEWATRVQWARLRRSSANASFLALASAANATSPLLHLFCVGCRSRVCSRAMENKVLHGHAPANERENGRRTRLTRMFTSDSPPLAQQVGILGPPERVRSKEPADGERPTQWDGCACIRIQTGCTGCGNHLGYVILTPCPLCLRDVAGGHVFLFLPDSVITAIRSATCPGSDLPPDEAIAGRVPSIEGLTGLSYLTWSSTRLPSRTEDFRAGLVGDPCDWLISSSNVGSSPDQICAPTADGSSRLPFWLKARPAQMPASLVRPSVSYSGALLRTPAIRVPNEGSTGLLRPPRPCYDLEDPNGVDVHAVCEAVDFGSLSRAQRMGDQEARSEHPTGLFALDRVVVGR